jgi:hypothetical protein
VRSDIEVSLLRGRAYLFKFLEDASVILLEVALEAGDCVRVNVEHLRASRKRLCCLLIHVADGRVQKKSLWEATYTEVTLKVFLARFSAVLSLYVGEHMLHAHREMHIGDPLSGHSKQQQPLDTVNSASSTG